MEAGTGTGWPVVVRSAGRSGVAGRQRPGGALTVYA
jgi:hypothetical protein